MAVRPAEPEAYSGWLSGWADGFPVISAAATIALLTYLSCNDNVQLGHRQPKVAQLCVNVEVGLITAPIH